MANWIRDRPWALESAVVVAALLIGVVLMPILIFYAGVATLGRYDGANLHSLYGSLFASLEEGSIASWVVFLGPYALYLLFRALRIWWRAGPPPGGQPRGGRPPDLT
jgi:hypothetical protein